MSAAFPHRTTLIVLTAVSSVGVLASTMYIPSIPAMARDLGVPVGQVQFTVAAYVVAFGLGNIVVGPLSDRFGRRGTLMFGNLLCVGASLLCALAPTVEILLIGRVLQALGACAGNTIARAAVRDMFDRDGTVRAMSVMVMALTIVPVLAPVIGGYIQIWFGWRWIFLILALWTMGLMILARLILPETNTTLQNQSTLLRGMGRGLMTLLRSPQYLGYMLAISSVGASFYAFVTAGPVIMIDLYGLTPAEFGIYSMACPLGFLFGSFITHRMVGKIDLDRLILFGGLILVVSGIIQAALMPIALPWTVLVPFFIVGISNGIVMPSVYAASVSLYPQLAGTAAGLTNAIQNLSGGITAVLIAGVTIESSLSLTVTYFVTGGAALAGAFLIKRRG